MLTKLIPLSIVVQLLAVSPLFGQLEPLATEDIYNQVSKSVVLIEDLESHGSGVVLTKEGLILTNFHVVGLGVANVDLGQGQGRESAGR